MTSSQELEAALKLWSDYVSAKHALLQGGFVRSFKSAEADLAEWIVAQLLQGELPASQSHPRYDVVAGDKRIQAKSVCKAAGNPNGYIITEKDRTNDPSTGATHYAFVFFDDLVPTAVYVVSEAFVRHWPKTQIRRPDLAESPETTRIVIDPVRQTK